MKIEVWNEHGYFSDLDRREKNKLSNMSRADGAIPMQVAEWMERNDIRNLPIKLTVSESVTYVVFYQNTPVTGKSIIRVEAEEKIIVPQLLFGYKTHHGISVGKDYPNPIIKERAFQMTNDGSISSTCCSLILHRGLWEKFEDVESVELLSA